MSSFVRLRILTAGESHGPALTGILEGVPAGFPIDFDKIDEDLARRQKSPGAGARMNIETDRVKIKGGIQAGKTTGGPIACEIPNLDFDNWSEKDIDPMTTPRPGHADLTGAIKYAHADLRLCLERASARETAMRVALGSILKQILEQFGIVIGGYVRSIGKVKAKLEDCIDLGTFEDRIKKAQASPMSCTDLTSEKAMGEAIESATKKGETLGGVFEIVALSVPPGLGSYAQGDRRIESRLAGAAMSIQAVKGVEIGPAFENATMMGRAVQDEISLDDSGRLARTTNRAGGIEGGITTSKPVIVRVAMKPIATTLNPTKSVDLFTMKPRNIKYERSDICPVPRAVVVGEAMVAMVIADALFEKLGGDSSEEMLPRFEKLRSGHKDEFSMDNKPWRFGYRV